MKLLEVMNLSKAFGGLLAIDDLSLSVDDGEILGLIGPNGSGKTTFINTVSGFLRPSKGSIFFKGESIGHRRAHRVARKGIVRSWQHSALFGDMTVLENVIMGYHFQIRTGFWEPILRIPFLSGSDIP